MASSNLDNAYKLAEIMKGVEDRNLPCGAGHFNGCSLAGKRRSQSWRKATGVMVELIHSAQSAGITAGYVLFGSWFSAPKTIITLKKEECLDAIAMMKKGSESIPAKLVYVRNKGKRKDWLVLVSTDTQLPEEEIIRIYGKRPSPTVYAGGLGTEGTSGMKIPCGLKY